MKKLFIVVIILVLLLVGGWAGATYFMGSGAEKFLTEELEKAKAQVNTSGMIDWDKSSFTGGFLSSEGKTNIRMTGIPAEAWGGLTVTHRIYHGPFAKTPDGFKFCSYHVVSTVDMEALPAEIRAEIEKATGGKAPFTMRTSNAFDDSVVMTMEIPPIDFETKEEGEDGRFEFAGMSGSFKMRQDKGGGSIEIGAMKIEDRKEDFKMEMDPATITVDIGRMQDNVMLEGNALYHFPKVTVTAEGKNGRINDLKADYTVSSSDEKTVDGAYTLSVAEIKLPAGPEFDPFRPVAGGGASFGVDVSGLHLDKLIAMVEAQKKMSAAQAKLMESEMSEGAFEEFGKAGQAFAESILNLVQTGLGLGTDVNIGDGSEKSEFALNLDYISSKSAASLKTMGDLIGAISGDVKLRLNKSAVPPEMAAQLAKPLEMGFIEDKGTHYEANGTLKDSTLNMNGQSIPLLEQLGPKANEPVPWAGAIGGN